MGLIDYLKTQFLEIIEWQDDSRDTISFRYPDLDKEIKNGAQLIVRESQTAQFVYLGQFGDTFGPGKHTLTTDTRFAPEHARLLASGTDHRFAPGFDHPGANEAALPAEGAILHARDIVHEVAQFLFDGLGAGLAGALPPGWAQDHEPTDWRAGCGRIAWADLHGHAMCLQRNLRLPSKMGRPYLESF